jgi:outer membrane protein
MRTVSFIAILLTLAVHGQQAWTLDQCLQRAEQQNLTFRGEQLNADLAGKASDQSQWALLPDLNAGATHGYNWGKAIDRYTNTFATERVRSNNLWLSSNWTLFQGMRLQNQRLKAGIDADAAMKGLEASRNAIRKQVVSQFLSVLGFREGIKAAEKQAASTHTRIEATKALVDAGRVARAQLYDLEAQLAREEMSVVDLQNQEQQALLQLGQSLFLTTEEQRTFTITGPSIAAIAITEPTTSVDTLVARVLAADPAFARATLSVESADKNVRIARSGSLPTLSFNASFATGYSGLNTTPVGEPTSVNTPVGSTESGETVYVQEQVYSDGYEVTPFGTQLDDNLNRSVGFTLNVPIFNNMSNRLAIDQARVQREQAVLQQESERQRVQRDVQDALLQQRAAYRKYEAANRSLQASEEALRYAEERFTAGAITIADLELAKASVINATADVIRARYDWLMAAKSLDILMGLPVTL